jgi:hypothetical protein
MRSLSLTAVTDSARCGRTMRLTRALPLCRTIQKTCAFQNCVSARWFCGEARQSAGTRYNVNYF